MQAILLSLVLQIHGLPDAHLSPREFPVTAPASVTVSRGYFEKKAGRWEEDHRNEIERGMYDGKGRLIGIVELGLLDSIYRFKNAEDLAGRVTETTITTSASFHGREMVFHDREGRVSRVDYFDEQNERTARVDFHYSRQERLSRRDEYVRGRKDSAPKLVRQVVYAYSSDGAQIKQTSYRVKPKKLPEFVLVTDGRGNPLSEQVYDEWGSLKQEFEYLYDFAPAGYWTKQVKRKKLGEEESVPVDALYREVVILPRR